MQSFRSKQSSDSYHLLKVTCWQKRERRQMGRLWGCQWFCRLSIETHFGNFLCVRHGPWTPIHPNNFRGADLQLLQLVRVLFLQDLLSNKNFCAKWVVTEKHIIRVTWRPRNGPRRMVDIKATESFRKPVFRLQTALYHYSPSPRQCLPQMVRSSIFCTAFCRGSFLWIQKYCAICEEVQEESCYWWGNDFERSRAA